MKNAIIITGAGTGLGKELAIVYAQRENEIILTGRRLGPLKEVQEEIVEHGGEAYCYSVDISDMQSVEAAAQEIIASHSVNFLINNAGAGTFGPLESQGLDEIHTVIDTNVKGTIFMTKAFLPYLLAKPEAKIMNIISTAGLRGKVNETVYAASKFAVRGFTESLAKELEGSNVTVTAVYMGGMNTPFWHGNDHIKDKSRLKSPKDVAVEIAEKDQGQPEIHIG